MVSLCDENGPIPGTILKVPKKHKEKVAEFLKYSFVGAKSIEEAQKKLLNVILQCRKIAKQLNCNVSSWSHESFSISNMKDYKISRMKSKNNNCYLLTS